MTGQRVPPGSTAGHLPPTRPPRRTPGAPQTGDFNQQEHLSRQQAAERLIDIAYALAAGGPLEISLEGRLIKLPVANELSMSCAWRAR